jgi:hypothetical protein
MRMRLVRMQHHRVAVLERKLLPGKVSDRSQHFLWWRSRWHREDEFLNQLRRFANSTCFKVSSAPILVQIQKPVIEQQGFRPRTHDSLAIVGLYFKLTLPAQVVEVIGDGSEAMTSPVQDFDHDFRGSVDGSGDVLELRRRQLVPSFGALPATAHDVYRPLTPKVKVGHDPASTSARWRSATP